MPGTRCVLPCDRYLLGSQLSPLALALFCAVYGFLYWSRPLSIAGAVTIAVFGKVLGECVDGLGYAMHLLIDIAQELDTDRRTAGDATRIPADVTR